MFAIEIFHKEDQILFESELLYEKVIYVYEKSQ